MLSWVSPFSNGVNDSLRSPLNVHLPSVPVNEAGLTAEMRFASLRKNTNELLLDVGSVVFAQHAADKGFIAFSAEQSKMFLLSAIPVLSAVAAQTLGKFTLGVWFIDETPASWNAKMGRLYPSFQAAQNIPYNVTADGTDIVLDPSSDETSFLSNPNGWNDQTDASVFMTIYNYPMLANGTQGLGLITDEAIEHLANRLASIAGSWMPYGQMPTEYIAVWTRMYPIMKRLAPNAKIVWSPNYDLKSGDVSYWPGSDYVDIVGTSVYLKGWGYNNAMPASYISDSIQTVYNEYALLYNKPFVISEASGAWETGPGVSPVTGQSFTSVTSTVDQATFQADFWSGILNVNLLAKYPLLWGAYIFEIVKQEEFYSDFRVSNDSAVRAAFQGVVDALDATGLMLWAHDTSSAASSQSIGTSVTVAISASSEITDKTPQKVI
ncbi:hypothetical protein HDU83_001677 [Entophlyctis luteolus]|nr:hypothetical protein HDU83_001677 [Entophlyctis luteolus]